MDQGVEFVIKCIELMHGGEVFIPKIPSMRVMDLAKAIAPESKIRFIGIRPGEKLHEVLISEEEARHTLEFDDVFVIEPQYHWWSGENWKEGKRLNDGFRYSSDTNSEWVTVEKMKRMIDYGEIGETEQLGE